ncbi:hypothetical protein FQN54_006026 [Arachnomyces sp. PD_36]|nr:hypothetical protein FQN54_006026 [Arachnomyces sp. PD_36]
MAEQDQNTPPNGDIISEKETEVSSTPPKPMSRAREISAIIILCLTQLLTQAGLGQVLVPLHIIGREFGTEDPAQLSWYAAAYSLTVGTFILIAGRWGDVYGHRLLVVVGYTWFGVWSVIAGCSAYSDQIMFDVCRALQGIGPAIVLPNSIAIISNMYPPGFKKNLVFSLYGATAPNGFLLGACFSSLLAKFAWWPWAFWIMGICCVLAAIATQFVVPIQDSDRRTDRNIPGQLDPWGSITGVVGLILVNFAWNQGPAVGWSTPYTYFLLIIGLLILVLFFVIELRTSHPLVPIRSLSKETLYVLACIAGGWSCFGIFIYYICRFLIVLRGHSILSTVAQLAPCGISGLFAAFSNSILLPRLGPEYVMFIALLAFLVGSILVATAPVGQTYWIQTFLSVIIMPWGMDLSYPAGVIIMSSATPREHQGVAASLMNTVVNYSISIGLGIAGTAESRVNSGGLDILKGYHAAYYVGIGLAAVGWLVSLNFVLSSYREKMKMKMKVQEKESGVEDDKEVES